MLLSTTELCSQKTNFQSILFLFPECFEVNFLCLQIHGIDLAQFTLMVILSELLRPVRNQNATLNENRRRRQRFMKLDFWLNMCQIDYNTRV